MIARVYYSIKNAEVIGVEAYLRQKGFAVEKVPVDSTLNEKVSFGGAQLPKVRIVINESSYASFQELFEAEQRGELPTLLRG